MIVTFLNIDWCFNWKCDNLWKEMLIIIANKSTNVILIMSRHRCTFSLAEEGAPSPLPSGLASPWGTPGASTDSWFSKVNTFLGVLSIIVYIFNVHNTQLIFFIFYSSSLSLISFMFFVNYIRIPAQLNFVHHIIHIYAQPRINKWGFPNFETFFPLLKDIITFSPTCFCILRQYSSASNKNLMLSSAMLFKVLSFLCYGSRRVAMKEIICPPSRRKTYIPTTSTLHYSFLKKERLLPPPPLSIADHVVWRWKRLAVLLGGGGPLYQPHLYYIPSSRGKNTFLLPLRLRGRIPRGDTAGAARFYLKNEKSDHFIFIFEICTLGYTDVW